MLHSRMNNSIIRNLHERCLRYEKIYNDKTSFSEEFFTKGGSLSVPHRNIQALATELCKIKKGFLPEIFIEIFARETESHYNLSLPVNSLKKSVKKWKPQDCICRMCKIYINGVSFLSQLS